MKALILFGDFLATEKLLLVEVPMKNNGDGNVFIIRKQ